MIISFITQYVRHRFIKYIFTMLLSLTLFIIGLLGFINHNKNIILMLISLEIMLLAVTLTVLNASFMYDDNLGNIFSIAIISIAGAESVLGLTFLVSYYKLTNNIFITNSKSY